MTKPVEPESRSQACVYLYRDRNGTLRYVGRGATPERAQQHANGSHNAALAALIASGQYELEIAGPYEPYEIAAQIEAALISAMTRPGKHELYNLAPGNGHRFLPLGIPSEFAERPLQSPLSVSEIGRITGGALIVRNSFGDDLEPGRPRLDPLSIDTKVLVDNIRRKWLIENLRSTWIAEPEMAPKVVLAAAGPLKRRYVPTAIYLDTDKFGSVPAKELPLALDRSPALDACSLRGRLLSDAKFARGPIHHFIWVDASGATRWPAAADNAKGLGTQTAGERSLHPPAEASLGGRR